MEEIKSENYVCCKARNGATLARGLNGGNQLLASIFGVDSRRFCQIGTHILLKTRGKLLNK